MLCNDTPIICIVKKWHVLKLDKPLFWWVVSDIWHVLGFISIASFMGSCYLSVSLNLRTWSGKEKRKLKLRNTLTFLKIYFGIIAIFIGMFLPLYVYWGGGGSYFKIYSRDLLLRWKAYVSQTVQKPSCMPQSNIFCQRINHFLQCFWLQWSGWRGWKETSSHLNVTQTRHRGMFRVPRLHVVRSQTSARQAKGKENMHHLCTVCSLGEYQY